MAPTKIGLEVLWVSKASDEVYLTALIHLARNKS